MLRTRSDAVVVGSRGRVDDGNIDRVASGMSGDDGIRANRVVVVVVGEVAWLSPEGTTSPPNHGGSGSFGSGHVATGDVVPVGW